MVNNLKLAFYIKTHFFLIGAECKSPFFLPFFFKQVRVFQRSFLLGGACFRRSQIFGGVLKGLLLRPRLKISVILWKAVSYSVESPRLGSQGFGVLREAQLFSFEENFVAGMLTHEFGLHSRCPNLKWNPVCMDFVQ